VTARPGNCSSLPLVKVALRTACIKNGKLKIIKILEKMFGGTELEDGVK